MTEIDRYDYAFDPDGDAWAARLLRRVPRAGSVLELGPGPGAMTRVLAARGHAVTVVEGDAQAVNALQATGATVICSDLEQPAWTQALGREQFDVILACDVLEHLRNPDEVLARLLPLMRPGGQLLISVPNIAYAGVVAALRNGVFEYTDKGQLDRTHLRFFTRRSMEAMLLACGWQPHTWEANRVPVEESELGWCWRALGEDCRVQLLSGWTDSDVYQWMVMAAPGTQAQAQAQRDAQSAVARMRDELEALRVVHERERASLIEHQKAFSEARSLIEDFQQRIAELQTAQATLQAENTGLQTQLSEVAHCQDAGATRPWWRRISLGRAR